MKNTLNYKPKSVTSKTLLASAMVVGCLFASGLPAQEATEIRLKYPQVADLFNAFDVTQAKSFEEIAAINANPATQQAQDELQMSLSKQAKMSISEKMASEMMAYSSDMPMGLGNGPHHNLEV